jgi:hypothetical protein
MKVSRFSRGFYVLASVEDLSLGFEEGKSAEKLRLSPL